jgi:hypothetical protein
MNHGSTYRIKFAQDRKGTPFPGSAGIGGNVSEMFDGGVPFRRDGRNSGIRQPTTGRKEKRQMVKLQDPTFFSSIG